MSFVPVYIFILGFTIIVDYFAGLEIEKSTGKRKRILLIGSLIANIGVLAIFKYYNFIAENISWAFQFSENNNPIPSLSILLPIGLSFHTFQAMSYTIEVYRGKQKAVRNLGIYSLYVMFYPQLVAGPIERPQNIIKQFYWKHTFNYVRVGNGLKLILWGFFLKIAIADNLALIVNRVFDNIFEYQGLAIVIAVLAFSIQIFCDFAGYSIIAIGAAQVMGFELMTNFRQPYLAQSISEFWARWHISLSTWFKDYVYIPLGGNKVPLIKWCLNISIVFIISGLWHGANWTFVIWGAMHGLFLISGKLTTHTRNKLAVWTGLTRLPVVHSFINIVFTFLMVSFAWIFFRASNISSVIYILKNMFVNWRLNDVKDALNIFGFGAFPKIRISIFLSILLFEQLYQEYRGSIGTLLSTLILPIRWAIYFFLIFAIILFGAYQEISFIYFQF